MAWWGIALANGPHINNPAMPPERSRAAWEALGKARERGGQSRDAGRAGADRGAREALRGRPGSRAREPLDEAYAEAMRACWRAHPDDADVGTLFAESLMDLQPWDLWTIDGKPQAGDATEIVATLEAVLARVAEPSRREPPLHPRRRGVADARARASRPRTGSRTLVPAPGHLVHMPAHIDIRVGRFADASAGERARDRGRPPQRGAVPARRLLPRLHGAQPRTSSRSRR